VLRLGERSRDAAHHRTGLHFKIPFIENVVFLDNRILSAESPNLEVLASDNQRLEVDSFVRYKIVDPLRFYQTVGGILGANNQLASVLTPPCGAC